MTTKKAQPAGRGPRPPTKRGLMKANGFAVDGAVWLALAVALSDAKEFWGENAIVHVEVEPYSKRVGPNPKIGRK